MTITQYNIYPGLTPVRVVNVANLAGTYVNGTSNNGVGASLTGAAPTLTIDGVVLVNGDRVLLQAQTSGWENGIYIVSGIGGVWKLTRSDDMNDISNMFAGQYVTVGAGTVNAGAAFVLSEPLPLVVGQPSTDNNIVFTASPLNSALGLAAAKSVSDNALPSVASVGGATVIGAIAKFQDVAGTIDDDAGTATNLGTIQAGASGTAGNLISYPATALNGRLIVSALNAGGDFTTTIRNSVMAQDTVYSLGDIGAATGGIPVSTAPMLMKQVQGAAVAGGSATQNVVDAFCTATSVVLVSWVTQANPASIIRVVPGVGSFDVISSVDAGAGSLSYLIIK